MSDKYKEVEGAVDVNSNITPTTRQPIDQLDSSEWMNMTIPELVEQRAALYNRMSLVESMGRPDLIPTMKRGLAAIDLVLKEKGAFDETHLI